MVSVQDGGKWDVRGRYRDVMDVFGGDLEGSLWTSRCGKTSSSFIRARHMGQAMRPSSVVLVSIYSSLL